LTDYVFGVSAVDAAGNESLITTLKVTSGLDETPDTDTANSSRKPIRNSRFQLGFGYLGPFDR
jgi:hypothetical protein